jgi:hypothetical protein
MNKTQTRLTEMANELQDIAAKYEELAEVTDTGRISMGDREVIALSNFKDWLHKEGYCYTRGVPFYKLVDQVKSNMYNMTSMITELQKQNSMLMAGVNLDTPPTAMETPVMSPADEVEEQFEYNEDEDPEL